MSQMGCWYLFLAGASLSIAFSGKLIHIEFVLLFLYCYQYQPVNCLLQSVSFSPGCRRCFLFLYCKSCENCVEMYTR